MIVTYDHQNIFIVQATGAYVIFCPFHPRLVTQARLEIA